VACTTLHRFISIMRGVLNMTIMIIRVVVVMLSHLNSDAGSTEGLGADEPQVGPLTGVVLDTEKSKGLQRSGQMVNRS
jgi:hypothetical protein